MERSTREVWAARVARLKESGLSARQYASEIGVNPRSLSWWRWQLTTKRRSTTPKRALARRSTASITKAAPTISPLTFVEMTAAVIEVEPLEVVLPSSVRIRVRPGFDAPTLGRVLDVLEARR